jgi:N-acyl-D-aspartate/D-glutamate deacylase
MVKLAHEITIAIVANFGAEEMLRLLSHPYWVPGFWMHSGLRLTFRRCYHYPVWCSQRRNKRAGT